MAIPEDPAAAVHGTRPLAGHALLQQLLVHILVVHTVVVAHAVVRPAMPCQKGPGGGGCKGRVDSHSWPRPQAWSSTA
jgi:hypothetical protein